MRHFTRVRRPFHVRLACVRHAASVQSEPESNSPVEKYLIQRTEVLKSNSKLYFPTRSSLVKEPCRSFAAVLLYATFRFPCQQLFSKFFSEEARSALRSSEPLCLSAFLSYAHFTPLCQTLFSSFSEPFFVYINQLFDNIHYFIEKIFDSLCLKSPFPARKGPPAGGTPLFRHEKTGGKPGLPPVYDARRRNVLCG